MKGFTDSAIVLLPSYDRVQFWSKMQWKRFNNALRNLSQTFEEEFGIATHIYRSAIVAGENGRVELLPNLGIVQTISKVDEDFIGMTLSGVPEPTVYYRDYDKEALATYPAVRGLDLEQRIALISDRCLLVEKYLTKTYYKVICDLEFSSYRRVAYRPKKESGCIYLPFDKDYRCSQGYLGDEALNIALFTNNILSERSLLKWR